MLLIELWRHLKTKDPLRRVKGLLKSFASGNSVQNQSRSLLTGLFPLDSGISRRSKITIVRRVHPGGGYFWTKEWITLIFIWLCYYVWQFLWFTVLPNIISSVHFNIIRIYSENSIMEYSILESNSVLEYFCWRQEFLSHK